MAAALRAEQEGGRQMAAPVAADPVAGQHALDGAHDAPPALARRARVGCS